MVGFQRCLNALGGTLPLARRWLAGCILGWGLCTAATASTVAAPAPAAPLKLRIVGGLAGINQFTQLEAPFWTRELARLSGGRYSADIVAFDRAGVPGNDMLRLLQLGVVPFGTVLMSSLAGQYPLYTAADLPGLNPDMAALRSTLAAVRPQLETALRNEHGVEPLAIYVYPAQTLFCRQRLTGLADLQGRTVRVSSAAQGDFMAALNAQPKTLPFAQLRQGLQSGALDCAVTGTMSGNTIGLHQQASYLHPMAITWGLAIFAANRSAWQALPEDLRALLRAELPKLEAAVWAASERETRQGVACNTGAKTCTDGERGSMTLVAPSRQDDALRQQVLLAHVLPRWFERCGARCAELWQRSIAPARGIESPVKAPAPRPAPLSGKP